MNPINVDPKDVEAFLVVAECGNFRRAAERLGLSQPTISARIKRLEIATATMLLERTTRRVSLTPAGHRLRDTTENWLTSLRSLLQEFRDEAGLKTGRIALGASPSVAGSFLPAAIRQFQQRWPGIELTLRDDFFGQALDRITHGEVDLAVVPFEPSDASFRFDPLMIDHYFLAASIDHPFAVMSSVSIQEIAQWPLITMPPQSMTWRTLKHAYEAQGLEFRPAIVTQNAMTTIAMVRANLGVAFVTLLSTTAHEFPGLTLLPLRDLSLTRKIGIVRSAQRTMRPAAVEMTRILHACCQDFVRSTRPISLC